MVSKKDIINFLRQLSEEERRQILKEAMKEVKKEARKAVKKEAETFFTRVKKKPVDLEELYGFPVSYKEEITNLAIRGKTHKEIANALDISLYREQKLWKEAVKENSELRRQHLEAWRARQKEITSDVDARIERLKQEGKTESRKEARKNIIENERDGLFWRYHPDKGSELGKRIGGRGSP